MRVAVLLPVLNEEAALPAVLSGLRAWAEERTGAGDGETRIVVCDNGSTDRSVAIAIEHGAEVARAPLRGYGTAVLSGMALLRDDPPDVVVVYDGDHSHDPADLPTLLAPIARGDADLVLGERLTLGDDSALTPQQRYGNRLATTLMAWQTGHRYRDMGPLRAIRWSSLETLRMSDPTWGWNVEMQMRAVQHALRVLEIPVHNRPRIGTSKISGTVSGVARAGAKILLACWRYR